MIVVDASALTASLVDDGDIGAHARSELGGDVHWAAPGHLLVEVVSAVRGLVAGGKLPARRGGDAIRALAQLTIDTVDVVPLLTRMWQLRDNLTAYDAAYVAAAESLDCPLVTGDGRLRGAPRIRCPIRLITG